MSKIKTAFANGKAFIPFVTCGDPSLDVTEQIVYAMTDAGAISSSWYPVLRPDRRGSGHSGGERACVVCGTTTDKSSTWCAVSAKRPTFRWYL